MSRTPEHQMPTTAAGASGPAASLASAHGKPGSVPPLQVDSAAELVMSRLTALRLDTYAQTLRALSPPTVVAPPARDEVSALTAAQFGAYAQMLQNVSTRIAAAHEQLMKCLANRVDPSAIEDPGDTTSSS